MKGSAMRNIYCLAITLSMSLGTAQAAKLSIPEPFNASQLQTNTTKSYQIARHGGVQRGARTVRSTRSNQSVRVRRTYEQPRVNHRNPQRNVYVNVRGRNMRWFVAGTGAVIAAGAACYRDPYGFGTVQNTRCCFYDSLCFNEYYIY